MGMVNLGVTWKGPALTGIATTVIPSRPDRNPPKWGLPNAPSPQVVHAHRQPTSPWTCLGFLPRAAAGAVLGASLVLTGCAVGPGPLSEAEFKEALATNRQRTKVVEALFVDPEFAPMWRYLVDCPTNHPRGLGPVALETFSELDRDGLPYFGTWSMSDRSLMINPDHPANDDNPQELVDTVVHEVIHAIHGIEYECTQKGAPPSPLGAADDANPPSLKKVRGTPADAELLKTVGPSARGGCHDYLDINAEAQALIGRVVMRNIQATGVGRPTLTFVNLKIRKDPAALKAFQACRDQACSVAEIDDRREAIAECQAATIAPVSGN